MHVEQINRMVLEIQFGAFSDHFVFSMPKSFGGRILTIAQKLIINLLRLGFMMRGAVVCGPLYHRDNVIFGPALLDAVKIEENEAFYPRILVADDVINHCTKLGHLNDAKFQPLITDQTGRTVINPFMLPLDGPDDVIESLVKLNFFLPEIKKIIDNQIDDLTRDRRYNHAEKWRYLRQFVGGPVLTMTPKLERFWK